MKLAMNEATIERKDYVSEIDGKIHYLCNITFPTTIYESDRWIKFKDPFSIECYHIEEVEANEEHKRIVYYTFDFGMSHFTQLKAEHNFILRHMDNKSDEERIVFDVIFDLMHAFFHVSEDPNYTDYHWALYGNLKDRVEIGED